MKIIAGLGNPGFRYRNTRHNIGFRIIDELAKKHGIRIKTKGFDSVYGVGRVKTRESVLMKPLTYMNLSGKAVKAMALSRSTEKSDLLVISDDFNIPLGSMRLRESGSAGGHNGLKSIIEFVGEGFPRLRIGIASGIMPDDRSGYVLSSFTRKERLLVDDIIYKAIECIELWISEGITSAMGRFND